MQYKINTIKINKYYAYINIGFIFFKPKAKHQKAENRMKCLKP